ncbi:ATP-binding protein, partial [Lacticaseibacillus paracasei]
LLRPLLSVSKSEIRQYAHHHQLAFVTDESNSDRVRTRNRIRLDLLPTLLDQYNPNIVEDLSLLAARLSEDDELLFA